MKKIEVNKEQDRVKIQLDDETRFDILIEYDTLRIYKVGTDLTAALKVQPVSANVIIIE